MMTKSDGVQISLYTPSLEEIVGKDEFLRANLVEPSEFGPAVLAVAADFDDAFAGSMVADVDPDGSAVEFRPRRRNVVMVIFQAETVDDLRVFVQTPPVGIENGVGIKQGSVGDGLPATEPGAETVDAATDRFAFAEHRFPAGFRVWSQNKILQ